MDQREKAEHLKAQKNKKLQIRLNEEERAKLAQRAKQRGLSVSAYILLRCTVLKD